MATQEQLESTLTELKKHLNTLNNIKTDKLIRTSELGTELHFIEGQEAFLKTLNLFNELSLQPLELLALNELTKLKNEANSAVETFKQIQSFTITQHPKPQEKRNALIQQVRDRYDTHFSVIIPILSSISWSTKTFFLPYFILLYSLTKPPNFSFRCDSS